MRLRAHKQRELKDMCINFSCFCPLAVVYANTPFVYIIEKENYRLASRYEFYFLVLKTTGPGEPYDLKKNMFHENCSPALHGR